MSLRSVLKNVLLLGAVLLWVVACTTPPAETPQAATEDPAVEGRAIVLGDISDDPGEVIEGAQPLADYLAARLGDFGITEGQVKVATTADEMTEMLKNGEVDLYFDSVYPATLISDASGAQPFLRRWRRGVSQYYTIIFASTDSDVTSVEDLPGHMLALDNPYSTSGYVLPAVYLVERGLKLAVKQSYEEPVADDEVGFVFSYDDENTLQWVVSGLVAAGATDNDHYEDFPPEAQAKLKVLAETEPLPRQVAVARPGMDPELLEAIKQVLITAHEDDEGRAALEVFDKTARFDEFPEGIDAALNRMRELMEIVQDIPTS